MSDRNDMLDGLELFAYVGPDEGGSPFIGLKQAMCPAGIIPMVAVERAKMEQQYIEEQMARQAAHYQVPIALVRCAYTHTIRIFPAGNETVRRI